MRPPPPRSTLAEVRDVVKVPEAVLVFAGEHARFTWRRERRSFSGELLVEVADVFLAANGGDEGRGHLPLQQRLPVHVLEGDGEKETKINLKGEFFLSYTIGDRSQQPCNTSSTVSLTMSFSSMDKHLSDCSSPPT